MKLQCQVEVVNRLHNNLNIRSNRKYLRSTLGLGKEPKSESEYFILHFSSVNKHGTKYRVKSIKQVFVKCINEGKATIRFEEPPHDLCIQSEAIQLTCFMRQLKCCVRGDAKNIQLVHMASLGMMIDSTPKKLVIRDRSEFPEKGLPRTLESLHITGVKLCNFRRDILLLKHLTYLDLSSNEMEHLPPEFGRMPCLNELYLSNNKFGVNNKMDWRWLMGPAITKSLKLLDLSSNKIESIPKSIWKLQSLVTLKLDSNLLKHIPGTLGRISSLRYLTISCNQLTSLPSGLLQCHLDYIDLSLNKFQEEQPLPDPIKHSHWDFSGGSLVDMASKVVLKNKIYYAANIIPHTLVQYLDNAHMCLCGAPVLNTKLYANKELEFRAFSRVVVFHCYRRSTVTFLCYFCSFKCYNR